MTLVPGEIESVVDENDKRIYHLRIHSTQPKHIGEYSCTLTNGGGSVKSKKVKVTCEKSPQFATEVGKTVKAIQGRGCKNRKSYRCLSSTEIYLVRKTFIL